MRPFPVRRFAVLLCFIAGTAVKAQELSLEELPGLKERALVLNITTRVAENKQEVWTSSNSKVTIPGRPVSIKLVGGNVVVAVQLTPYLRDKGRSVLVAQGQIWVDTPNEGIRYKTTMQTIPINFGEQIYFLPLGADDGSANNPHIELRIELLRYEETLPKEGQEEPAATEAAAAQ
ncbi:MAG: hypothetical protein LBQ44_04905 [Treponema sp.]|jgi:hypothetical protein|nr:hypothetical protein [Treponema sp.]